MPRPRSWTDDELREAVRVSATLSEVCRGLGAPAGGRTFASLRKHILRLGIDASHLPAREMPFRTRRSWTDEQLSDAVRECETWAGVLRRLGYQPNGGMHRYIKARVQAQDLDISHFTGQAWSANTSRSPVRQRRELAEILVVGSSYPSATLRRRLIAAGLKENRCEVCGLVSWRSRPLTLALDHINGDPSDNRLVNLRILCPNCHAQTDTWCRRNIKRAKPA